MKSVLYFSAVLTALALGTSPAMASFVQQCQSAIDEANSTCGSAMQGTEAASNARNVGTMNRLGSGPIANPGAKALCQDINTQKSGLESAKATCESAKSNCNSQCEQAANSAQPQFPNGPAEASQIRQMKSNECNGGDLQGKINQLDSGIANLMADAGSCSNTDKNSGGGGSPMMMPPSEETEPKHEVITCDHEFGYRASDCNDQFIEKCSADASKSYCTEFTTRFCSAKVSSGSSVTIGDKSVVVDKTGEGLGGEYCRVVAAKEFCQAGGRDECPTCKWLVAREAPLCRANPASCSATSSIEEQIRAGSSCPVADPIVLEWNRTHPTETETNVTITTPTTPVNNYVEVDSFSQWNGGGTNVSPNTSEMSTATVTSTSGFGAQSVRAGNGITGASQPVSKDSAVSLRPASYESASQRDLASVHREVAPQFGPGIDGLLSRTYSNLCQRGQFISCKSTPASGADASR